MHILNRFLPRKELFSIVVLILGLIALSWAQSYQIEWSTMDAGGAEEGDSVHSTSYRMTCAIGQGSAVGDTNWISGATYLVHPGFRKIDHDWRYPFTQFLGEVDLVDTITVDSLVLQWTGQDTTIEEGPGWGIWVYDVQYRVDTDLPGVWTDLNMGTTDTCDTARGLTDGHWFYFRIRGHDLATNFYDWASGDTFTTIVDIESVYVNTTLYQLSLATTDDLCSLWVTGTPEPSPYIQNYSAGAGVHVDVPDSFMLGDTIMGMFDHWVSGPTDTFLDITMTGNIADTAVYNLFYNLEVISAYDTPVPDGDNWFAAGSEVSGYMTDGVVDLGGGFMAVCTGFLGTGSAPIPGASGTSFWFVIYQPSTVTWQWWTGPDDTELCTLIVFSPYGHPMPADTSVYPIGTTVMCMVEDTVFVPPDTHVCTGWLGGGSVPAAGAFSSFSFPIMENSWCVWVWDNDPLMPLIVENEGMGFDPVDGYDAPDPTVGLNWLSWASTVTASVTTPADGMQCVGYWGSGDVPSADSATSVDFIISCPSFIHWRWFDEDTAIVYLTVWSEYDNPVPPIGTSGYPIYTVIDASVSSPWDGHICTGYWGDGSVPTDTSVAPLIPPEVPPFVLDENSNLVWVWDGVLRFPLLVENEGIVISPPDGYDTPGPTVGTHWYDAGAAVSCSVTTPADGMQCVGHFGFGSVTTDLSTNFTFVIDEPSGVSWHWLDEFVTVCYLSVYSEFGSPDPPIGTMGYECGTFFHATVQESVWADTGWAYNSGWQGGGSVLPSGAVNWTDFTLLEDSWIVWQWGDSIRWPFVVISDHDAPLPPVGTNWFYEGDTIYGSITPVDGIWFCVGYEGWGGLDSSFFTNFDFVINEPAGVEWLWSDNANKLIVIKDPITDDLGGIALGGTWRFDVAAETVYVPNPTLLDIEVSNPDTESSGFSRYRFIQWDDAVLDSNRTEMITTDMVFTAQYAYEHHIIVQKDPLADTLGILGIGGIPYVGGASAYQEVWWEDGTNCDLMVTTPDNGPGEHYTFREWDDASTNPNRTVFISSPDTFTAFYDAEYLIVIEKYDSTSDIPMPHGCIYTSEGDTCEVPAFEFWVDAGTSIDFAVTSSDTASSWLFQFYRWSDMETDSAHSTVIVDAPDTFIAYYASVEFVICIEMHQYGSPILPPDSAFWIPDDPVDPRATYSMSGAEAITIHSCSTPDTIRVQMFLGAVSILDTLDAPVPWIMSLTGGARNDLSIRARFENSVSPPTVYNPVLDYLKLTDLAHLDPASDASETGTPRFGPYGANLTSSQDLYLFMQLIPPSSSIYYGRTEIKVVMKATLRMP